MKIARLKCLINRHDFENGNEYITNATTNWYGDIVPLVKRDDTCKICGKTKTASYIYPDKVYEISFPGYLYEDDGTRRKWPINPESGVILPLEEYALSDKLVLNFVHEENSENLENHAWYMILLRGYGKPYAIARFNKNRNIFEGFVTYDWKHIVGWAKLPDEKEFPGF